MDGIPPSAGLDEATSAAVDRPPSDFAFPRSELLDVLEALPEATYITDAQGRISFYNEAAAQLWGVRPELGKSKFCGSWKLCWPNGTPLPHDQSPIAMALKEKRPIRGLEAVAERPDGTRVPFLACPSPLYDRQGNLTGAVNVLVDLTERAVADETAQRLAAIVEFSDDAILAKDLNGTIITWNRGAERLFGYTAQEAIGQPVQMLIPHDRPDEEPTILRRIRMGERIDHYETVRQRKDGSLVDISLCVSPIRDQDGRIIGASKIARDITERRLIEQQQRLLLREMNHRVKNLFTLASSIVTLSARSAATSAELSSVVSSRLAALARAHALTVPPLHGPSEEIGRETTLNTLIRTILAPFDHGEGPSRARIVGNDVPISGDAVTSFSLLLHEFAVNSAKYGALSVPEGSVDITCCEEEDRLILTWAERGGPSISGEPDVQGFGTLLSEATARGQFNGEIVREWRADGLFIRLGLALSRLSGN